MYPSVSIIIPARQENEYLNECIRACQGLDYPLYEMIVLPDEEGLSYCGVRVIPTGRVPPSIKRDMGIQVAKGEILAFIDDDAYPPSDWLKKAVVLFEDPQVGAVGGPAITPKEDNLLQQASGLVYSSLIISGSYAYRYTPKKRCEVDDYPSCNFLVRRSVIEEVGGFTTKFWPGEDTLLCLEITKTLRKRIIYTPEVLVYHHRKPLFGPHLRQVKGYALHRGYFAKRFKQTSLRLSYFLPSLLVSGVIGGGIISFIFPSIAPVFLLGVSIYIFLVIVFAIFANRSPFIALIVALGIVATHFTYGLYFFLAYYQRDSRRRNEDSYLLSTLGVREGNTSSLPESSVPMVQDSYLYLSSYLGPSRYILKEERV